jgi:hypothetical protein
MIPNFIPEFTLLPGKWHGVKGEITLRLGLVFWCLFFIVTHLYLKLPLKILSHRRNILLRLGVAGLLLLFCALPTSSPPWLSLFLFKTFPMFRSIVRSMIFSIFPLF